MKAAKPVIVGSGLTGLAISRELSKQGIGHLLIGSPPFFGSPKLGESLNLEGSYFLQQAYSEYARFFFKKTKAITYIGGFVSHFDADKKILPVLARFFGLKSVHHASLLHIDRIGFDRALFQDVTSHPLCTFRNGKVTGFRYCERSDRIDGLALDDGSSLDCSFVFDASNHARVLARGIGIPCHFTSKPQRIVFTHYTHPDYELGANHRNPEAEVWSDSTSVVILDEESDGIHGAAWFIPLGDYLSLGISLDEGECPLSDEEVMNRVEEALIRRELDFRDIYPGKTRIASARNQYFVHERAYGANWMMAGPTFAQIWFPSSSGIGMAIFASLIAARFLESPARIGDRYEKAMRQFLHTHEGYRWLMASDFKDINFRNFGTFSDSLISEAMRRTATQCRVMFGGPRSLLLELFRFILDWAPLRPGTFMYVKEAPVEQLTRRVYGVPE